MHIPRGYWHRATRADCGDGLSFHATFGFTRRTGASWMEYLAEWCRDDPRFRRNLERAMSSDQVLQVRGLIDAAATLAAERTPLHYLDQYPLETTQARQVPYLSTFGPLEAVVCTTPFPPRITVADGRVALAAVGKRLTLPGAAEDAVWPLLSGHPVKLGTNVDGPTQGLAELLVREGLCSPLTPELSSGYTDLVTDATPSKVPLTQASTA
ncbi:cupin domain-containing protein [Yinghuangia sp. ASG 101]|uniref:cupin domain-containing protein n=1 Tax=Yinghuangia sp. ASG 101 TaxID=2896848 RepID=UPI001E49B67E|nr:cupin domain-containing protein [Yinghuangia sp. ASG 101]